MRWLRQTCVQEGVTYCLTRVSPPGGGAPEFKLRSLSDDQLLRMGSPFSLQVAAVCFRVARRMYEAQGAKRDGAEVERVRTLLTRAAQLCDRRRHVELYVAA